MGGQALECPINFLDPSNESLRNMAASSAT